MSSNQIVVLATFTPKSGAEQEVEDVLRGMIQPTRSEGGNEMYDLCRSSSNGRQQFHLVERYRDQSALEDHRQTDHYRSYRAAIPELLDEDISVVVMDALDVV
ncbi:quinol monooxygenase YgiN [Ilumatobacter fluminis]|uniref:Quinol monooxygenase YgiN n=1 Tax=Ilumatobacter fluminis TaxID=467091 RepID=A0A4R7HVN5_9ACTN|nr:putative quinol monooxygenase [Ilumatobacter fluminis]TDT14905.1 quinol monooxygenase YgiN [Ilumatobacter fluminis]